MKKKLIGIYGGTFAPVHNGHVQSAKAFMEQMKLDYLFIIPTYLPPHKQIDGGDDPMCRLKMCELAFADVDGVVVSDVEIRRFLYPDETQEQAEAAVAEIKEANPINTMFEV